MKINRIKPPTQGMNPAIRHHPLFPVSCSRRTATERFGMKYTSNETKVMNGASESIAASTTLVTIKLMNRNKTQS